MKSMATGSLSREALDFAPGLLAIQESPPAKLPRTVLYTVAALFALLLLWALFGQLDVVASAEGRLVPQSYVKIVQPAEAGIVQDILVSEGQPVEAGQVLIRMDAKLIDAETRTVSNELALKRLQLRRVHAELAGRPMASEPGDPPDLFAPVAQQLAAHRRAYLDALGQEQAILGKSRHDLQAAEEVLHKLKQTLPTYQRSAAAYEKLGKDGFFSPLAVEEKQRDRLEKEQDLRAQEATVASLQSTLGASDRKIAQITSNYRSELQNERVETELQFRKLSDDQEKMEHKSGLLSLRAPQRGIIKDLATHTPGTVVSPGTVLMSLVPHEEPLQAEVLVKNEDVGFVHIAQRVRLKLSPYPFQKYGMIDGTISHVGPDVAETGNPPSKSGSDNRETLSALRYKALIRLDNQFLETNGQRMRLTAGMQLVAEISQGSRTVMEYLLSPVQKAWQEAGRER
jgi:membrane fusion protein, hemolysin D